MFSKNWKIFTTGSGLISLLFAIIVIIRITGGIAYPPNLLIFGVYALVVLLYITEKPKVNSLFVSLIIIIAITLLLSRPDPLFRSWERFLLFCIILFLTSPLLESNQLTLFRKNVLFIICVYCIIVSIASFFCYFLGINLMLSRYEEGYIENYLDNFGTFSGLTNHSVVLGYVSGVACIVLFYVAMIRKRLYAWFFWVLCFVTIFFSASRSALIACIGATLFQVFSFSNVKKSSNAILIICFIIITISPYFGFVSQRIVDKQKARTEMMDGLLDSRTEKFQSRWKEFKKSPIYGIGFASVDPNGDDNYDIETGHVEPGNSWLAVLSMTGILGGIPMFIICLRTNRRIRKSNSANKVLYYGLTVYLFLHMMSEGYLFSAGSPLCIFAWLVLGCAYSNTVSRSTR